MNIGIVSLATKEIEDMSVSNNIIVKNITIPLLIIKKDKVNDIALGIKYNVYLKQFIGLIILFG